MDAAGLPPELVCPICSCLLEDAVMMPCCAGEYEEGGGDGADAAHLQVQPVTPVPGWEC